MKKMLSVIIPVYNMEKYLPRLFESIRRADTLEVEWLFVDDGSEDNSAAMIESFAAGQGNTSLLKQSHRGACKARNLGFEHSVGEYIYFFDSDDYFTNHIFPTILKIFHTEHPDLLVGNGYVVDEQNNPIGEKFSGLQDKTSDSIHELFFIDTNPGNKIFRRDIMLEHQVFFDDVAIHQDLNFYLKYIPFCKKIRYIHDFMYYYLIRDDSIAHRITAKIAEVIQSMEGVYAFYRQNGLWERYRKELEYNYVKHLCFQIDKLPLLERVSDQIRIALEFIRVLKTLDYETNPYISRERATLVHTLLAKEEIYRTENYDAIFAEAQGAYQIREKRTTLYNHILTRWLSNKIKRISVSDTLQDRGIHSIAIYGMGNLGRLLYEDLLHNGIEIRYFIDQQAEESLFGNGQIRIIRNTEIPKQEMVDAIIVTPVHVYESICEQLHDIKVDIPVISLQDIINGITDIRSG